MAKAAPQVRTGRVSKINYAAGTYEVTYKDRGGAVTCEMNGVSNGRYKMPEIGDIVNIEHNGNGTVMGTAVGTIWNQNNVPVNGRKGIYRQEFARTKGKAYEEYDDETGTYIVYADKRLGRNSAGEIYDEAKGSATLTAAGQLVLRSTGSSAAISASGGVGIAAGAAVSVEAGSYYSLVAAGNATEEIGGDAEKTVSGDTKEEYSGTVERTYEDNVTEETTGNITRTVEGDVTDEITGDVSKTIEGVSLLS